jgi:glutamate synthase domain-containing protein 2
MTDWIWGRYSVLFYLALGFVISIPLASTVPGGYLITAALAVLTSLATLDYRQRKHAVLGNYPLLGRFRYFFETIRPELRQYFWESDDDRLPYSRNQRAMVYQRAKSVLAARPFGSLEDMYKEDFSWLNHTLQPSHIANKDFRVAVGEGKNAYAMSILNISGTSFGSLSPPAIEALSMGARLGGFAHNTGEGSFSPYHMAGGGDTVWQISTGYFGCRTPDGRFCGNTFAEKASAVQIKMIEIKLSQGAKPGHGGMLLGSKVTPIIAKTRGIQPFTDCISPASHTEFSTPNELLDFVQKLRKLSGGKPVGIKLCIGHPWEFLAIVKAMVQRQVYVDFVTVDGAEGGTGAAPVEFTDHLGSPLADAVVYVSNCLIGAGLRDRVKIAASGKLVSAYDMVRICALGADWVNMARPFMFTLGCIQARDCASNHCPSGVATMDPKRYRVLDVAERAARVRNFHANTVHAFAEMLEATGLAHPSGLTRRHIVRRLSAGQILLEDQIYPHVNDGELLQGLPSADPRLASYWQRVDGSSFAPQPV